MEIKIENLTKAYGDFKAVDNMNLNIADGGWSARTIWLWKIHHTVHACWFE